LGIRWLASARLKLARVVMIGYVTGPWPSLKDVRRCAPKVLTCASLRGSKDHTPDEVAMATGASQAALAPRSPSSTA